MLLLDLEIGLLDLEQAFLHIEILLLDLEQAILHIEIRLLKPWQRLLCVVLDVAPHRAKLAPDPCRRLTARHPHTKRFTMALSSSTANQIARNRFAIAGAKTYAARLPPDAKAAASSLEKREAMIATLNAQQEAIKTEMKKVTLALQAEMAAAAAERQKIIRLAEAIFGVRAPEIAQFRPTVEARTAK